MIKSIFIEKALSRLAKYASYSAARIFPGLTENKIQNPIFIIGCGRSGTSMLTRVIASHEDIAYLRSEANDLWHPKAYPWYYSDHKKPPFWFDPCKFTQMSLGDWTSQNNRKIKAIFGAYQVIFRKKYFLNKSALISIMVPHILELFPEAHFIHIYRDGRAVALSWAKFQHAIIKAKPTPYKKNGYFFSFNVLLEKCAEAWKDNIIEIDKQVKDYDLDNKGIIFELSYEDFCANPEEYINRIAAFLSLDPDKFGRMEDIKNMNYKYRLELDQTTIEKLTKIMKIALKAKGYM